MAGISNMESIEQRLADVERRLDVALRQLEEVRGNGNKDWLSKFIGRHRGDPAFAEVIRLGKEFRDSHRPPEQE